MQPQSDSPPAIVLGIEHPRGVAVVQSLGRIGVHVVGMDRSRTARGMYSRYLREKLVVAEQPDEVVAALDRHAGGVLIPTNDFYLELVARNFGRLSGRFILTTPPWAITGKLMDKQRCYELARSIGLGTPLTFAPATLEELERLLGKLDFDKNAYLLTKQLPVGAATDASTRRYTRVGGGDAATLRARCLEIFERTGELPLIAEIVPGEAASCFGVSMVLDRNGENVASYAVRRLQVCPYSNEGTFVHPYELGANVYCESTHDAEALEATRHLLRAAEYYGTATVEFRRDTRDGKLKVIKVDPRFVRATSLSMALGVDLPRALYLAFTGKPAPAPVAYPSGTAWVWPTALAARHTRPILRNLRSIKATAFLRSDDPLPFLIDVLGWAKTNALSLVRRASPSSPRVPR